MGRTKLTKSATRHYCQQRRRRRRRCRSLQRSRHPEASQTDSPSVTNVRALASFLANEDAVWICTDVIFLLARVTVCTAAAAAAAHAEYFVTRSPAGARAFGTSCAQQNRRHGPGAGPSALFILPPLPHSSSCPLPPPLFPAPLPPSAVGPLQCKS